MSADARGKVNGRTVEVTVEGVMSVFKNRMRTMLDEHGITEPDPEPKSWYELGDFVGVLFDVKEDAGENALAKIGEATPGHVDWPADVESPADALAALPDVYDEQHQRAPGTYAVDLVDDSTATVTARTPYPCKFDEGLLKGTVESAGASYAKVSKEGGGCRDRGGDACVYEVTW